MNAASIIVIVLATAATIGCVAWFLLMRQHPENAASHDDAPPTTTSGELHKGVDRPAGPGAESMDPDAIGGDHRPPRPT